MRSEIWGGLSDLEKPEFLDDLRMKILEIKDPERKLREGALGQDDYLCFVKEILSSLEAGQINRSPGRENYFVSIPGVLWLMISPQDNGAVQPCMLSKM